MPFVPIEKSPLGAMTETPKGAFVTPGQDDVALGSDAPEAPGLSDTFGAGWRQENTIASQLTRKDFYAPTFKEDGFDPWEKIKGTPLEANWQSFADIHNSRAFDMRKAQIEQEEADKKTLASAPWYKAVPAVISAAALDWPSLLPGGAMIRGARGGYSLAKTAAVTGALSGVSGAAQEAALKATQQTRTPEEMITGVGSSAIIGALLGAGGAKLLNHLEWKRAIDAHDAFLAGEMPTARAAETVAQKTVSGQMPTTGEIQPDSAGEVVPMPTMKDAGLESIVDPPSRDYAPSTQPSDEAIASLPRFGGTQPEGRFAPSVAPSLTARASMPKIEADLGAPIAGTLVKPHLSPLGEAKQLGGIIAYHGSQHSFDRFDISKIGTGEGAQTYGHGLYFAENKTVAEQYAEGNTFRQRYTRMDDLPDAEGGNYWLEKAGGDKNRAIELIKEAAEASGEPIEMWQGTIDSVISLSEYKPNMYQVRINADPEHFLDWDKPLNEQSAAVSESLNSVVKSRDRLPKEWIDGSPGAEQRMREAGIPGIKYLDQGSRNVAMMKPEPHEFLDGSKGWVVNGPRGDVTFDTIEEAQDFIDAQPNAKGSYNYVVFDDNLIEITHKNGEKLAKPVPAFEFMQTEAAAKFADEMKAAGVTIHELDAATVARAKQLIKQTGTDDHGLAYERAAIDNEAADASMADAFKEVYGDAVHGEATRSLRDGFGESGQAGAGEDVPSPFETLGGTGKVSRPQTLISALQVKGLKDFKGELKAADINKRFPGLVRKNGLDLDKAREAMEELGYLPANSTPDDLVQAILSDEPVYAMRDLGQADEWAFQQRAKDYDRVVKDNRKALVDRFGEDGATPEIYDRAANLMAQERDLDPLEAISWAAFDTETNRGAAPASVGAAAIVPASLEGNTIAGRAAAFLANASRFPTKGGSTQWNPLLRVLHSASPKTRELGLSMAENPLYLNKNIGGVASAPAAETLMKEWQGGLAEATRFNRASFAEFRKAGGRMTQGEFNEAVAEAMRNNDRSPIPQVQAAAQSWRAKVVDPLKDAAIKARLLPEDVSVETAASYFTRWWNRNKLIAREQEFKRIVRGWVEASMPRWKHDFDYETTQGAMTKSGKKRDEYLAAREAEFEERFGLFPGEVSSGIADDVFRTLTGQVEGADVRPELIKVQARGPLKERTFSIPDALIKDFLENDVERVMDRYVRTMGADVEIANKFGDLDFAKLEAQINADYERLQAGDLSEKQKLLLDVARKNDIADIKGIWDLLRGTGSRFAHPWEQSFEHISRMVRLYNYIRLMGESSLASLAETIRPAMVHGLLPYMQTVGQLATNMRGVKMSANEAKLAGQIAEGVLGHRMALMTEISDPYSSTGKFETFMRHMSDFGSKWNGIRLLTDAQKTIASVMTQNRILDSTARYGAVNQKERAYLAYLGIDQRMAERITAQFREHGKLVDGVRVAGTEDWTDAIARRTYRAALNKDVDSIITTPGVADVPLFVNTPTGAAMMQFRRFALAAHQRVLLRGLQEDQTRFLGGMIAMTALGMFTTWLKAVSANREEKLSDFSRKPGWWVAEGLDRSGVLAGAMEVSNAFEKATGLNPIKTPLQAFDEGEARLSQKNQNRNDMGVVFGPSLGLGEDVFSAAKGGAELVKEAMGKSSGPTKQQKNAAERLIPFNSYPVARQFMRYVVNPQ
jgi:hypothetical protein